MTTPQDAAQLCVPRAISTARGLHPAGSNHSERKKGSTRDSVFFVDTVPLVPYWGKWDSNPGRTARKTELILCATALSLYDYDVRCPSFNISPPFLLYCFFPQIIVVDANRAYACFAYGMGDTLLGCLPEGGHYDAHISLPAFFGKRHFCVRRLSPYDHLGQHACPNITTTRTIAGIACKTVPQSTPMPTASTVIQMPPVHIADPRSTVRLASTRTVRGPSRANHWVLTNLLCVAHVANVVEVV